MSSTKPIEYEPKRNNMFLVEFPEQFDIESWSVEKINKPKFSDGKWDNIKIEFIDVVWPSTSQGLFKIVNFLKTNDADNKKLFEIKIKSLSPVGDTIEEWAVHVEKVLTIDFGKLDYGDNGIQTPFLIIKPLNCILNY